MVKQKLKQAEISEKLNDEMIRRYKHYEFLVYSLEKAFHAIEASKSYPPCLDSAKTILKEAIKRSKSA